MPRLASAPAGDNVPRSRISLVLRYVQTPGRKQSVQRARRRWNAPRLEEAVQRIVTEVYTRWPRCAIFVAKKAHRRSGPIQRVPATFEGSTCVQGGSDENPAHAGRAGSRGHCHGGLWRRGRGADDVRARRHLDATKSEYASTTGLGTVDIIAAGGRRRSCCGPTTRTAIASPCPGGALDLDRNLRAERDRRAGHHARWRQQPVLPVGVQPVGQHAAPRGQHRELAAVVWLRLRR